VKLRLLLSYVALTAAVLILLEVPLGILEARQENDTLRATARRDASELAVNLAEPLADPGSRDIAALAARYRLVAGSEVAVMDRNARTVVALDPSEPEESADELQPELLAALRGNTTTARHPDEQGPQMAAAIPVRDGDRTVGAVAVAIPAAATDRHVHRVWLALIGLAVVLLAVAATIGSILGRSLTAPLAALQRAAGRFGQGDLTARAPEVKPAELGALAADFNIMADRITGLVETNNRFVADATHQLRTSMTALRLRLENVAATAPDDVATDVAACQGELDRLSRLVDGVLTLSRVDNVPDHRADPESIDASAIVAERCANWAPLAEERDVGLVQSGPDHVPISILARRGDLEQIIDNLLDNAVEASPAGTAITIDIAASNGRAVIHVTDQGPGLDDEERARAFDRFWQGRHLKTGSSGLGLAIVKELALANGGDVTLDRAPSGGLDAVVKLRRASAGT
jgi:signal transduction histidine kinase